MNIDSLLRELSGPRPSCRVVDRANNIGYWCPSTTDIHTPGLRDSHPFRPIRNKQLQKNCEEIWKNTTLYKTSNANDPAKYNVKRLRIELTMLDFRLGAERALPVHARIEYKIDRDFLFGNTRRSSSRSS